MAMDIWPFYPDRLSELMDKDMITFVQIAAGKLLKMATVVVELKDDQVIRYPVTEEIELQDWADFCKRLRNKAKNEPEPIANGDAACSWFDEGVAREVLTKARATKGPLPPSTYGCHMHLQDAFSVVYVGERFPVAVLLVGQRLNDGPDGLSSIISEVDKLDGRPRSFAFSIPSSQVPSPSDDLAVRASPHARADLKRLAQSLELWKPGALEKLQKQATKLGGIATNAYESKRIRMIEEFYHLLSRTDGRARENRAELKQLLAQRLEQLRVFCQAGWIGIFGAWEQNSTVLQLIAQAGSGTDAKMDDLNFPAIHFNWKKAGVPEDPSDPQGSRLNLPVDKYLKGLKARQRGPIVGFELVQKAEVRVPFSHADGQRTLLCMSSFPQAVELEKEMDFFGEVSQRIGSEFMNGADFVRRIEMQNRYKMVADHIAHQVKSALTPVRSGAELVATYIAQKPNSSDIEKARKKLRELDQHVENLADLSTISLSQLYPELESALSFTEDQFSDTDIIAFVEQICHTYKEKAAQAQLIIEFNPNTITPIEIRTVQPAMWICFQNLFDNALKYCASGSSIRVTFSFNDPIPFSASKVTIEFSTIGRPIDQDEVSHLFERGAQGRHATSDEGSGLGLWECKEILRAHGGTIALKVHPLQSNRNTKNDFVIELNVPKKK